MRLPTLAALGAAAYAAFLVASVPAAWVAAKLKEESQGRVQLLDASGTLWRGTAKAVLETVGGPLTVDRVEWRFRPARLATGRLAFEMNAASPGLAAHGEIGRSLSAWQARDVEARSDVATASALMPWIARFRPEGTVLATSPAFSWDDRAARGELRVEWRGAALSLSDVRPLGTYRAEVRAEGGPAKVAVTTLDGPLRIAGQGTLTPPARLEFSGDARAEGPDARSLEPLLDLLGPRRADGARALQWRLN
jgi:general secretion pathway protein N